MAILIDIVFVLLGSIVISNLKLEKNASKKTLLILATVAIIGCIVWINHKFINSEYWWIISSIFIIAMFQTYFVPKKKNHSSDGYRGD